MTLPDASHWLREISTQLPEGAHDALLEADALIVSVAKTQGVSVEPLLQHARGVVEILMTLHVDADPLVAALFSDIPPVMLPPEQLEPLFSASVADMVAGVRKLRVVDDYRLQQQSSDEKTIHLEGLRKLLLGMAEDVRVVLIKLAERVQVMRELKTMPEESWRRVASETMDIFASLANRLGIWQLKWELEDLSFRFLEPENYQYIARLLDERREDREKYIAGVVKQLRHELDVAGVDGQVVGRPKHIYSIWRKMEGKSVGFQGLFDVRAVRVLVDDVAACYAVLGLVHTLWQPIPSEFDDYIASPKENRYQSLHTAVIGPDGKTLEIQIRTHEMHQHSEHGVAAHWGYKEGGRQNDVYREKISWLRQILEWKDEERDMDDFIDRFKSEVFQDRVYVLTPQGKVLDLPKGSTPLDFAYHIHTDVGHGFRGAKVNGKIVSIGYELKNGEQIEILTSKQSKPSRDWLNPHLGYLTGARARAKVRAWFRQQDFANNAADGRNVVEKEFQRLGLSEVNFDFLAKQFKRSSIDEFFAAVGCGDITSAQIAGRLSALVLPTIRQPGKTSLRTRSSSAKNDQLDDVHIMGVGELVTHIARCCKPVPHDQIVGYITRGRGITVHGNDCQNLLRLKREEPERLIDVEWSRGSQQTYVVDIYVRAFDRQGLLRDITEVLSNAQLNVSAVNTLTDPKSNLVNMTLTLDIYDVEQLSQALAKLEQLPNVMEAVRGFSEKKRNMNTCTD
ncbi:MAG: GTP diphosphokinase [Gammaproteobacteria bacterium]|nr:GTP diphosphokinase [Gammaproteobacteria bacterium]